MIHTIRTITVGQDECVIDRPIMLYRGDRDLEVEFSLVGNSFMFGTDGNVLASMQAKYAQLVVNTPSGLNMFSDIVACRKGNVIFTIRGEMIDEIKEVGMYAFQIRLLDATQTSRVTLPPVYNGIEIRQPIAAEDQENVTGDGVVDYAEMNRYTSESGPTFNSLGDYNKTTWQQRDVISTYRMNKIEDALYQINEHCQDTIDIHENQIAQLEATYNASFENINKNINERIEYMQGEVNEAEAELTEHINNTKADMDAAKYELTEYIDEHIGYMETKIDSVPCLLDAFFDTIESAISTCNSLGYTLVLTKNHSLSSDEQKTINICNILGRGNTIYLYNVDFDSNSSVTIDGVNFVYSDPNDKPFQTFCLNLKNSVNISNCAFTGFMTPMRVVNSIKNNFKNLIFERCCQGVYLRGCENNTIDAINFNNTEEEYDVLCGLINSPAGFDGVLLELCNNTYITNSNFNFCLERVLYCSDSDNVTFSNCFIHNSSGLKFVGYSEKRRGFICENIMMRNGKTDAFCQLYHCEDILINNIHIINEGENYIGWVLRLGQSVKNINITNLRGNGVIRSFIQWQEDFPTLRDDSNTVENINVENVLCTDIGRKANVTYALFDFNNVSVIEKQLQNLCVKNSEFRGGETAAGGDDSISNYGFSYVLKANTFSNCSFINNVIAGYNAHLNTSDEDSYNLIPDKNHRIYPMLITGNYEKLTVIADVAIDQLSYEKLPKLKLTPNSIFNISGVTTATKQKTSLITKQSGNEEVYIDENYIINGEAYNISYGIYLTFSINDIIYIDVYSDGVKGFLGYDGSSFHSTGTNVESGSWVADGKIRLYEDTYSPGTIVLRSNIAKRGKVIFCAQSK